MTLNVLVASAAIVVVNPATMNVAAAAGFTVMPLSTPVIEAVALSVAEIE